MGVRIIRDQLGVGIIRPVGCGAAEAASHQGSCVAQRINGCAMTVTAMCVNGYCGEPLRAGDCVGATHCLARPGRAL